MKKIAFTICAKNYIGLAQVLEKSILDNNQDIDFLIIVADEITDEDNLINLPDNIFIAKEILNIDPDQWIQMAFKYDLTEFCTSIKPSCFKFIFEKYHSEFCIYFDPDILVFNSLDCIFDELSRYSIILTPHITTIEEIYTGNLNERNLLYGGMYNLGFLALKSDNNSHKMLDWWEERLEDRCYRNMMENYFTDQKWMDFLPTFFPSQLLISFNLGLNLAPWNFHEREIIIQNDILFIKNRINQNDSELYPLIFVHFSGFSYELLLRDIISQGNINNFEIRSDYISIFQKYTSSLRNSNFSNYINLHYSYNYFSNQTSISLIYRRLYRRLLEDNKIKSNPFNAQGHFFQSLKKNGLIKDSMRNFDKSSISNVQNAESKTLIINRFLVFIFKIIGSNKFFLLVRLMRLYSKTENHVYLIEKSYLKEFKIRN